MDFKKLLNKLSMNSFSIGMQSFNLKKIKKANSEVPLPAPEEPTEVRDWAAISQALAAGIPYDFSQLTMEEVQANAPKDVADRYWAWFGDNPDYDTEDDANAEGNLEQAMGEGYYEGNNEQVVDNQEGLQNVYDGHDDDPNAVNLNEVALDANAGGRGYSGDVNQKEVEDETEVDGEDFGSSSLGEQGDYIDSESVVLDQAEIDAQAADEARLKQQAEIKEQERLERVRQNGYQPLAKSLDEVDPVSRPDTFQVIDQVSSEEVLDDTIVNSFGMVIEVDEDGDENVDHAGLLSVENYEKVSSYFSSDLDSGIQDILPPLSYDMYRSLAQSSGEADDGNYSKSQQFAESLYQKLREIYQSRHLGRISTDGPVKSLDEEGNEVEDNYSNREYSDIIERDEYDDYRPLKTMVNGLLMSTNLTYADETGEHGSIPLAFLDNEGFPMGQQDNWDQAPDQHGLSTKILDQYISNPDAPVDPTTGLPQKQTWADRFAGQYFTFIKDKKKTADISKYTEIKASDGAELGYMVEAFKRAFGEPYKYSGSDGKYASDWRLRYFDDFTHKMPDDAQKQYANGLAEVEARNIHAIETGEHTIRDSSHLSDGDQKEKDRRLNPAPNRHEKEELLREINADGSLFEILKDELDRPDATIFAHIHGRIRKEREKGGGDINEGIGGNKAIRAKDERNDSEKSAGSMIANKLSTEIIKSFVPEMVNLNGIVLSPMYEKAVSDADPALFFNAERVNLLSNIALDRYTQLLAQDSVTDKYAKNPSLSLKDSDGRLPIPIGAIEAIRKQMDSIKEERGMPTSEQESARNYTIDEIYPDSLITEAVSTYVRSQKDQINPQSLMLGDNGESGSGAVFQKQAVKPALEELLSLKRIILDSASKSGGTPSGESVLTRLKEIDDSGEMINNHTGESVSLMKTLRNSLNFMPSSGNKMPEPYQHVDADSLDQYISMTVSGGDSVTNLIDKYSNKEKVTNIDKLYNETTSERVIASMYSQVIEDKKYHSPQAIEAYLGLFQIHKGIRTSNDKFERTNEMNEGNTAPFMYNVLMNKTQENLDDSDSGVSRKAADRHFLKNEGRLRMEKLDNEIKKLQGATGMDRFALERIVEEKKKLEEFMEKINGRYGHEKNMGRKQKLMDKATEQIGASESSLEELVPKMESQFPELLEGDNSLAEFSETVYDYGDVIDDKKVKGKEKEKMTLLLKEVGQMAGESSLRGMYAKKLLELNDARKTLNKNRASHSASHNNVREVNQNLKERYPERAFAKALNNLIKLARQAKAAEMIKCASTESKLEALLTAFEDLNYSFGQ